MRVLNWLLRAFLFFTLFAFALNNQQTVAVNWFFGFEWRTRMVFVVLAAFAAGCAMGMLALLPGWWRGRAAQRPAPPAPAGPAATLAARPAEGPESGLTESRLREGL
jgi:uncharacterized integral membrane protein